MELDPPPKHLNFTKGEPLPQISSRGSGDRVSTPDSDSDSYNKQSVDQLSETSEKLPRQQEYTQMGQPITKNTGSSVLLEHPKEASRPRLTQVLRREHEFDSAGGDSDKGSADLKRANKFSGKHKKKMVKSGTKKKTAINFETQTDWDWVDTALQQGKVKVLTATDNIFSDDENDVTENRLPTASKSVSREASSHGRLSAGETPATADESKTDQLVSPFPAISEEFGIPILALSSDTDDSSDEEVNLSKPDRKFVTNVGPPPILQIRQILMNEDFELLRTYNRERDATEEGDGSPEEGAEGNEYSEIDTSDFPVDEDGNQLGMFGGICEFCQANIKPFPTLEQQQRLPPEDLYCCSDYNEFVTYTLELDSKTQGAAKVADTMISVKPHSHHGTKKARQNAKERAVHRLREREIARRQQEASGLHQGARGLGTRPGQTTAIPQSGPHASGSYKDVGGAGESPGGTGRGLRHSGLSPNLGLAQNVGSTSNVTTRSGMTSFAGHNYGSSTSLGNMYGGGINRGGIPNRDVRQMKTINYQLSSQRCLEEGWTIRPPSPLNDSKEEDVFVPEPINPALISSGKFRDRPIIEKYYPDNKKFLTMFPDGSGNVFYPSGNLAIMVSTVSIGQYNYIIHDDNTEDPNPNILAVFEPSGFASCYYDNGAIRLHLDQYGGIELDYSGGKRRRWSWKDEENHVHAPPFQPIRFSLNHSIGVRVMSQANIILTLSVKTRSCRFNVGSRLRLVAPQNIPHKEIEDNYLFLEETKQRVDTLLDKVSTLLKFPKSPKIEKILPPLHITSKKQRNEKMKREKAGSVMTNKSKQTVTTTASVTVN